MTSRLTRLVEGLARPRAFVVGDLLLDRYVWGNVSRVSPEAPIQILNVDREELRPGGAGNVARNLAALGASVRCAAVVGRDKEGDALVKLLRRFGVTPSGVVRTGSKPTAVKTRMIAHAQQMLRVDRERVEPLNDALERSLAAAVAREASRADIAVVSDYNKGTLTRRVCATLLRAFRGKPVLVGLKSKDIAKYVGATGAMLNRAELEALTGEPDEIKGARKLIVSMRMEFLVVTLGERGLAVVDRRGRTARLPTAARAVYDVTGAGDTCLAAFAVAHASGYTLEDSAAVANAAAAVVVGKVGTDEVRRDELVRYVMHEDLHPQRKIVNAGELEGFLAAERARGRKIVFTNGCFDVLHAGHVSLLQFAKARGDVLVVGLNTDRSVRLLKGPSRPVMNQKDRAHLLAALEAVDYVVTFDAPTPAALIRAVRPDVLVKGADWKGKAVVGEKYAARVDLAPLVRGLSTTGFVKKIRGGAR